MITINKHVKIKLIYDSTFIWFTDIIKSPVRDCSETVKCKRQPGMEAHQVHYTMQALPGEYGHTIPLPKKTKPYSVSCTFLGLISAAYVFRLPAGAGLKSMQEAGPVRTTCAQPPCVLRLIRVQYHTTRVHDTECAYNLDLRFSQVDLRFSTTPLG